MRADHIYVASNLVHILYIIFIITFSGAPNGVVASVDLVVTDDKAKFSLTVSDNSVVPAKEILYYLKVMIFIQPLQCITCYYSNRIYCIIIIIHFRAPQKRMRV